MNKRITWGMLIIMLIYFLMNNTLNERRLVSIVTPLYNSEKFLAQTIDSVLKQSYSYWEWIIIDDLSTDSSYGIAKEYASKDSRIIVFKNKVNLGPANTRNIGIEKSQGAYLTFLDSDDIWKPNFISKSLEKMLQQNCGFVFSSYERWNEDLTFRFSDFIIPEKVNYKKILLTNPISCLTAFIDIDRYGKLFMPNIPRRQDYALWLEYLKVIPWAEGIKEPMAIYRIRKDSLSRNKRRVIKDQFYVYFRNQKLGLFKSFFYLMAWAINGFLKYYDIKE